MKVFISWSGVTSHRVAVVLRDWLPSVIQSISPYVSSEDIDKGARWSTDIAAELQESTYGILCLTKANVLAPWINFEAGALGKSIDKARVSPFLFRLKRSEVEGPVLQFQSTVFEKQDVLKLLRSMNDACGSEGLEAVRLERAFEVWWPQLEKLLNEIPDEDGGTAGEKRDDPLEANAQISKVLEEVLELTRNNHRLLRDPSALFPPEYVQHVLRRSRHPADFGVEIRGIDGPISPEAIRDLVERYRDVLKFLSAARSELEKNPVLSELASQIRSIDIPLRYIARELGLRLPREALGEKGEF